MAFTEISNIINAQPSIGQLSNNILCRHGKLNSKSIPLLPWGVLLHIQKTWNKACCGSRGIFVSVASSDVSQWHRCIKGNGLV